VPTDAWKLALSKTMMSGLHRAARLQDRKLPDYPLPTEDPFYTGDEDLASLPPGTLLDWRPIPVTGTVIKVAANGWQIRFRSTDTAGQPISSVATLYVPTKRWRQGSRPLVSYQCAIDSLGPNRDPSYTLRRGAQREMFLMALALRRGWAVVTSDFTGPRRAYGAGLIAARISLDGIRASLKFGPGGLDTTAPVGAWGYSGGGQATAWMAEQQPVYAPDVRLVAVAAGGVPTDRRALRRMDGGFFSGLALGAAVGIDREYPETKLEVILNDEGRRVVAEIADMTVDELVAYFPFRSLRELTTEPDPFDTEGTRATNEELRLGQRLPTAPVYLYHAIHDQLVPISGADELALIYRKGGVDVTLRRSHLGEHIVAVMALTPSALRFLASRLTR
jgi:pimeloyl-ACP methyl ester carboxylesterase